MALTDREIIKEREAGVAQSYGLAATPKSVVSGIHSDTLTFEVTSDASMAEIGMRMPAACIVRSAHFTPSVALAANGSSYVTYDLQKRDGAGGAAASVATTNTNSAGANVSLAQFVPAALTLSTTAADITFAAGNVLTFKSTETGTPASPIGKVVVIVEWI